MKKLISLIGLVGLSLIMSLGLSVSQTAASSISSSSLNNEVTPLAISRLVVHEVLYNGEVSPPRTYYYSDSLGYSGTLQLSWYIYSAYDNKTSATYGGTVFCSGVCAASQPTFE
ncbi:hypothetical protein ACIQYS_22000 [Psychrobacillus sp. NPDC096426]|uniref:hypothetical protein n=1 Tax=Psychrobacillus sp. NPDC096426 TaxID=3364491 RepID=UPI0037F78DC5